MQIGSSMSQEKRILGSIGEEEPMQSSHLGKTSYDSADPETVIKVGQGNI